MNHDERAPTLAPSALRCPPEGSSSRLGTALRRERHLYIIFLLGVMMIEPNAHAADTRTDKKNVLLWYDALSKRDPALLDVAHRGLDKRLSAVGALREISQSCLGSHASSLASCSV